MRHVVVVELFLFEPLVISAYYGLTMGTGSVPNPARFPPLILTTALTYFLEIWQVTLATA